MKKSIQYFIFIFALTNSNIDGQTADVNANAQTKCIYQFLQSRATATNANHVMGQMLSFNYSRLSVSYDSLVKQFKGTYSKDISLVGFDYCMYLGSGGYPKWMKDSINMQAIKHFKKGGLVTVMANFRNPWSLGPIYDSTGTCSKFFEVYTNGNTANTNFKRMLDSVAVGFKQLQDSGVTVLFRPFHEMNGAWIGPVPSKDCNKWWSVKHSTLTPCYNQSATEFQNLWSYTFNYLTTTKALHNIIWVYAAAAVEAGVTYNVNFKNEMYFYPGNTLVDIVGVDDYNDTLNITGYPSLIASGKPFALCEFGPFIKQGTNNHFGFNYSNFMNKMNAKYPATCYWMSWYDFPLGTGYYYGSYINQTGIPQLIANNTVATLDKLPKPWCAANNIDELKSEGGLVIFPNPATESIQFGRVVKEVNVFNNYGEKILSQKMTNEISLMELKDGIYFIVADGFREKIIVTH